MFKSNHAEELILLTLTKPGIEEYAESKSEPVSSLLKNLQRDTYESMPVPWMLTGRLEGRFLKMMVQISAAKNSWKSVCSLVTQRFHGRGHYR
jgi:O-methyltransferase.